MNTLILTIVRLIIIALQYLMLFRAILSWFPQMQGNQLSLIVQQLTEPILYPFRRLLNRLFPALADFPFDISFIAAYLVLLIVERLLYF